MTKSSKIFLKASIPTFLFILFVFAGNEMAGIRNDGTVESLTETVSSKSPYFKTHQSCAETVAGLENINLPDLYNRETEKDTLIQSLKSCVHHSTVAWNDLNDEERDFLVKKTNVELRKEYIKSKANAAIGILSDQPKVDSSAYVSDQILLKMKMPSLQHKKRLGFFTWMIFIVIGLQLILFSRDKDAKTVKYDFSLYGIKMPSFLKRKK